MARFIKTNWFNIISVLVILFTAVRSYTGQEANVKSLFTAVEDVKRAVADLTEIVDKLSQTVTDLDKSQAVDKECLRNLKEEIAELKARRVYYNGVTRGFPSITLTKDN